MNDWKDIAPYFKDFFNTLAGKLTAGAAFALLTLLALAWFGAGIPRDYLPLIYAMVALTLLNALWQPWRMADAARKARLLELERKIARLEQQQPAQISISAPHSVTVEDGAAAQGDNSTALGAGATQIQGDVGGDVVAPGATLEKHTHIHPPPADPGDPGDPQAARSLYLNHLLAHCESLPLDALGNTEIESKIHLSDVYIQLHTERKIRKSDLEAWQRGQPPKGDWQRALFASADEQRAAKVEDEDLTPLPALEAVRAMPHIVLLGDPGSGKSALVHQWLGMQAAVWLGKRTEPLPPLTADLLPVEIVLRELVPALTKRNWAHLPAAEQDKRRLQLLEAHLLKNLQAIYAQAFEKELLAHFRRGAVLLALDGLDEVPPDLRAEVRALTHALIKNTGVPRLLITCRIRSYTGEAVFTGLPAFTLQPLEPQQIKQFVIGWYNAQTEHGRVRDAVKDNRIKDLQSAALRKELLEISSNPMMLTSMAIAHQKEVGLPEQKVLLYAVVIDVLLHRWQKHKSGEMPSENLNRFLNDKNRLLTVMERLAYEAHTGGENTDLAYDRALQILRAPEYLGSAALAEEFLNYVDERAGLLKGNGAQPGQSDTFSFPHRTFQEYLAGCHLLRGERAEELYKLAAQGDFWAVPAQFAAEELLHSRRMEPETVALAYDLLVKPLTGAQPQRAALWSAQTAKIYGWARLQQHKGNRYYPQGGAAYLKELRAALVESATQAELTARERADAADLADELGYEPEDLYDFIPIPDAKNPQFWIAKYPVTNGQYARFMQAADFEHYWRDLPGFGAREENYPAETIDGTQHIQRQPDYWDAPRFGSARRNAPVVGVSWYAAAAYANWLTRHWRALPEGTAFTGQAAAKLQFRLPKESEWEWAAGQLEYPKDAPKKDVADWQNDRYAWDAWDDYPHKTQESQLARYTNYDGSQIGRTTPVWLYPQGASERYGVRDLCGNVWEWQANAYSKTELARVVRGGSFGDGYWFVRCAVRDRLDFVGRSWGFGFRVVVSPCR